MCQLIVHRLGLNEKPFCKTDLRILLAVHSVRECVKKLHV